ncbi:MAG TPA: glycosyl transferase family protein [Pseudochrobactrum sp.]|nr:glycosyl transferase family protein [Pseudochrobactrum sp.]
MRGNTVPEDKNPDTSTALPSSKLGQLRLLIALDTLLVEGSVQQAAQRMGLSAPAMSRLLNQIREAFNDPILVRSGRRMIPTPRAEALRLRLRALADEAENLLSPKQEEAQSQPETGWQQPALLAVPPLSLRAPLIGGQPTPQQLANQLADLSDSHDPVLRFSRFLGVLGRGVGNSRPLTIAEAEEAFSLILQEQVDPMQASAFFSLIHYRGTAAQELAGMVCAARQHYGLKNTNARPADLDWPAYLSPNSPRAPWFLQAAKLLAQAGYKIALHGSNGSGANGGKIEQAARALDIPLAQNLIQAQESLTTGNIVYLPLTGFAPAIASMMALYPLFAARSPVGDCVHLLNPLQARASLLGVSRPAYRELHRDTARLLQEQPQTTEETVLRGNAPAQLTVLSSNRDVAEFYPFRVATILNLSGTESTDILIKALQEPESLPRIGMDSFEYWQAIWTGTAIDPRLETVITATAALGLITLHPDQDFDLCHAKARELWHKRFKN